MQKVLALVGPTAIGKTDLAITLAQKLNGDGHAAERIVNVLRQELN